MRPLLYSLFALLLALDASAATGTRDPYANFFDQTLGDFTDDLADAREKGKKGILIMFEMDECPFCHRMKKTVLNRPDVQDYFKAHFLIFSVDVEGDVEIVDMQGNHTTMKEFSEKQHRVRATPVFQVFDLDGRPIKRARYTGATKNAEEFLLYGRYVVEGAYEKMPFTRYKRQFVNP